VGAGLAPVGRRPAFDLVDHLRVHLLALTVIRPRLLQPYAQRISAGWIQGSVALTTRSASSSAFRRSGGRGPPRDPSAAGRQAGDLGEGPQLGAALPGLLAAGDNTDIWVIHRIRPGKG
jgi:hypothetical protein